MNTAFTIDTPLTARSDNGLAQTQLAVVDSLDEKTWRQFVDQHPQSNVFHTPELSQVFASARGYHPVLQAVVGEDGQVLALLLPVQVTLKGGLLRRLTTRSIAYGSVLCVPGAAGKAALELLLRTYTRSAGRTALFTELRNLTDCSTIQPELQRCGFVYEDHLDYVIDLTGSAEQVLRNIGSRTRKHIRHALRAGHVTVEEVSDRKQLPVWYDLVRQTYRAARVPLTDRTLFEAAFDVLQPRGMIKFWLARVGSAYVAASVELLYKDSIYGWYGGMDRSYAEYLPGELLTWHILEWGATHGYRAYDFGGAGKPGETYGVRDFKAKFGGQLVCYGRNTHIHSPRLFRLSERSYQAYRRLAGLF
jgi:lipid II:glycine glycyltransferase (peptidoglycan interpeptide bridge formation enzyme)